jgi:hypothetical protein
MGKCNIDWNLVINGCTALGTIAVAILAIWGEQIRQLVAGPKLTLVPHNLSGTIVNTTDGKPWIFYHLKVVNSKYILNAKNCRVNLTHLYIKNAIGTFSEVELTVPLTFVWSPAEITPPYINILKENVLDFGKFNFENGMFLPILLSYTTNFNGVIRRPGGVIRYALEIISDNYVSKKPQIFQVSWNGQISEDISVMRNNLIIMEIK